MIVRGRATSLNRVGVASIAVGLLHTIDLETSRLWRSTQPRFEFGVHLEQ